VLKLVQPLVSVTVTIWLPGFTLVKTLENCKLLYLECPIIANFNNNNLNIFDYLSYLKNLDYIPQEICEIHYYHGYLIQVDILFVKKKFYKNINFDLSLLKSLY
jgi:hypothetical protein